MSLFCISIRRVTVLVRWMGSNNETEVCGSQRPAVLLYFCPLCQEKKSSPKMTRREGSLATHFWAVSLVVRVSIKLVPVILGDLKLPILIP